MHTVDTSHSYILIFNTNSEDPHSHTSDADGIMFPDPAITDANRKRPPIPKE